MSRKRGNIKKGQQRYAPNGAAARTQPTTGNLGPRTPGKHGKTETSDRRFSEHNPVDGWLSSLRGRLGPR